MTQKTYSVRDSKTEIFSPPFMAHTHGEAERNFKQACQDTQSQICKFPEDYDLYYLGEYDNNTGKFSLIDTPQHLVKAIQLTENKQLQ